MKKLFINFLILSFVIFYTGMLLSCEKKTDMTDVTVKSNYDTTSVSVGEDGKKSTISKDKTEKLSEAQTTAEISYEVSKKAETFKISSSAFKDGETIPKKYTDDGDNISPPLTWDKPPSKTKSLLLICDDPDAPGGVWDHWLLFNIKPDITYLPEGVKAETIGALQGKNSSGHSCYDGPAPPKGKPHHYFFKLYALNIVLDLKEEVDKETLENAMKGHILAQCQLIGTYGR